jgi:hypothetical protein
MEWILLIYCLREVKQQSRGRRGRDHMVVGFATTTEFEPRSLQGVLDTTLCDKVCQ